jgi:uncharacterized protein YggE
VNRNLKNALIAGSLVVALAIALVSALPEKANAEEVKDRLISVTGEAKLEVKPDMATLNFGMENTAADAQTAQRENSLKMNAVIEALYRSGISKDDIQTSNFSLSPLYEWKGEKNEKQVLVGYRCNNTVTVRLKDISKVGAVIDSATTAGATNVSGITFGLQNPGCLQAHDSSGCRQRRQGEGRHHGQSGRLPGDRSADDVRWLHLCAAR